MFMRICAWQRKYCSNHQFGVISGRLPGGALLGNNTGTISGTPAASGRFSFTVSVFDSKEMSKQQPLQMTVAKASAPAPPTPTSPTPAPLATPTNGQNAGSSTPSLQQRVGSIRTETAKLCGLFSVALRWNFVLDEPGSPSLGGQATEFNVGESTPYSDALWNNHWIGPLSSQGVFDRKQTTWVSSSGMSAALRAGMNGMFGTIRNARWTSKGIPCYPNSNSWNHLTIKVQRTPNNELVYQSITFNGVTSNLNWTFGHGSANGRYGLTINYQMDGNRNEISYNVYLDNLTFPYQ
jgi:hypothetical protein